MSNNQLKKQRKKALRHMEAKKAWGLGFGEAFRVALQAGASDEILEAMTDYLADELTRKREYTTIEGISTYDKEAKSVR